MDKRTYSLLINMLSMEGEELAKNLAELDEEARMSFEEMKKMEEELGDILWEMPFDYD